MGTALNSTKSGLIRRDRRRIVLATVIAGLLPVAVSNAGVVATGDTSQIIDNGDGTWSSYGVELNVGIDNAGSVSVTGGELYSPYQPDSDYLSTDLGMNAGSSGTLYVSGSESQFISQGSMCVGDEGGGGFSVVNGASSDVSTLSVGGAIDNHYGIGDVSVDGENSFLSAGSEISVGNFGTGTMTITNGASAYTGFISVGSFAGSSGDLQINTGASFECTTMTIGYGSTGTVEIASGASVTLDDGGFLDIGQTLEGSDGNGTLTIDGTGTQMSVGGGIYVGDQSTGEIDVTNGASLGSTGDLNIGSNAEGTMNVKSDSQVTIDGGLYMGPSPNGDGTLNIDGEGTNVTIMENATIGGGVDAQGTIDVTNGAKLSINGTEANYIGDYGQATLAISGGSTVIMGATYVANAQGGNGLITVDGAGTSLTVDGFFSIGTWDMGELDITNGGQVTCESAWIGDLSSTATGTVVVDGEGSLLKQTGYAEAVTVGNEPGATGTITVKNKGSVTGDIMFIGGFTGSMGTVNVDGQGTTMSFGNFITVGNGGDGTLSITDGASVTSALGYVGGAGGTGILTVNGAGSEWQASSFFSFGTYNGTATVNVQAGGVMTSGNQIYIGDQTGSTATATIDGQGSQLNSAGEMIVGNVSIGTLTVQNQASSSSGYLVLGQSDGSSGTVNITGGTTQISGIIPLTITSAGAGVNGGSSATITTGTITIGEAGTGILNVTAGGLLTSHGPGILGDAATGNGTAVISDIGSTWNLSSNTLTVGKAGDGYLTVQNGAMVLSSTGSIAAGANSIGTATITGGGSVWDVGSTNLTIATSGLGTLSINTGGNVKNVNNATVGLNNGSSGSVVVAGPSTNWTLAGNLIVGGSGHGVVSISGTATVSDVNGTLGDQSAGNGRMTIDGTGGASTWTNSGDLTIGNSGTGTLTLQNGGKAKSTNGIFAYAVNSTGTANVNTSGSWTASTEIIVGRSGTGTLNIMSKGKVTDNGAIVGLGAMASGTVLIDGSGSQWVNNGSLTIGENGTATVTAQNGGGLNSTDAFIAENSNSSGTALITGAGSLWHVGGSLYVGGSTSAAGGAASLTVNKSGTLTIDHTLVIWPTGTVNLDGGSHSFGGMLIQPGGVLEMSNSKLAVAYSGSPPTATIRALLFTGFAKGAWDGAGINSTAAATTPGHAIGYMDAGNGEEDLAYTFDGDTNLDGVINETDITDMGGDGSDWFSGDFNYDGKIDSDDWSLLFLGSAVQSEENQSMPEPSSVILILSPIVSVLRRRAK